MNRAILLKEDKKEKKRRQLVISLTALAQTPINSLRAIPPIHILPMLMLLSECVHPRPLALSQPNHR